MRSLRKRVCQSANAFVRSPVANRARGEREREGGDPTFLLSLALHTDVSSSDDDDERGGEGEEGEVNIKRAEQGLIRNFYADTA